MAIREFTDDAGLTWRAWEIRPEEIHPQTKAEDYLADCFVVGWMVFETAAGDAKKRLCPYSMHWASATDDELREMLARADVVPPRKYAAEHRIVGENASPVAASGEVNAAQDVTDWGVVRTFRYPGGRLWTVCVMPAAEPHGEPVLHFTAGMRSVDIKTWPKDWADAPDENLAELLWAAAPRAAADPPDPDTDLDTETPRRRRGDGQPLAGV
jgi:hypothetical protein